MNDKATRILLILLIILLAINTYIIFHERKLDELQLQLNESVNSIHEKIDTFRSEESPMIQNGYTPIKGKDYFDGQDGRDGRSIEGPPGKDSVSTNTIIEKQVPVNGLSAYELAVKTGFTGTLEQWLESLKARTPVLVCNQIKNRWEVFYPPDTNRGVIKDLDKNSVACMVQ